VKSKESQVKAYVKFWKALLDQHVTQLEKLKKLKRLSITVKDLSGGEFLNKRIEAETRACKNIEKSLASAKKMLAELSNS